MFLVELQTIGDVLFWSYANLAMAHAAVTQGSPNFTRTHFMIRSRLFKGLRDGTMDLGALFEDDRTKLVMPRACCYCGADGKVSLDHLIPTATGGPETSDNAVWACRRCNSAKGARDLLQWYAVRGKFPPLLMLRRYLKLAVDHCRAHDLMAYSLATAPPLPFDIAALPKTFPAPSGLALWQDSSSVSLVGHAADASERSHSLEIAPDAPPRGR
jgi:5-methylcytosine-specific restriction endonuclease McrA